MTVNELLARSIDSVPLPGAPPRFSRTGASIGLAFLETAIRQNHIRRITEALTFEQHLAASRVVSLDISLGLLDDLQTAAGRSYGAIRTRATSAADRGERGHGLIVPDDRPDDPLIWVAI